MQKAFFKIQSAGATAYNLETGFHGHKIEVTNYTKWETDGSKVLFKYFKEMADGYALSEVSEDTSANRVIETSNGFTPIAYSQTAYAGAPTTINAVTAASPAVATTTAAHGYVTGQKVRIRDIVGDMGTSKLNDNLYKITVLSTTTFSLQDQRGNDVDTSGLTYTSGGQAYNVTESTNNENFIGYTLGTTIMGANDDILYVEVEDGDFYKNVGDVA